MTDSASHPLKSLCEAWLKKVDLSLEKKKVEFGQFAEECASFYDGPPDWMWNEEKARAKSGGWLEQGVPFPNFRMQLNKAFEAVARFGPTLFHQYPHVMVQPTVRPQVLPEAMGFDMTHPVAMEMYQQREAMKSHEHSVRVTYANIAGAYLNAIQRVTDKKGHARFGITEGIVRGLGLLHTKIYSPRGSNIRYPRSEFINECDFVKDGDAARYDDVQFQAVRCVAPINRVAEEYGLDPKELKGHYQSYESQVSKKSKRDAKSGTSDKSTFDLIEYWEIYSKNGFGDKLSTFGDKNTADYSAFGPYCYIVVARGVPYPLNLPTAALSDPPDDILERVAWPVPFWTPPLCDWPVSELGFYFKGGSIYPVPMFKALIGPIRFVNWCLSFLADKAAAAGTDYIVALKSAAEEIKKQIENGVGPYKFLEIPAAVAQGVPDVTKLVSVLQSPNFHEGLWRMVAECIELIDRLSGLNELLAGMTGTQMRSAEEAAAKQANTQIIPDDMAQKVEDWLTLAAKKEILAAQWILERDDIAAVVGEEAALVWEQQMSTRDFQSLVSDFEYTIEAGSARKPNVQNKRQALSEAWQVAGQIAAEMAMGGNPGPWNTYWQMWGEVNQMDASGFMIQPPDPNAPPPPDPEQQKAEAEIQKMGTELEFDKERLQMDLLGKVAELQMDQQQHAQEMQQEHQRFRMESAHDKAKSKQDLAIQKQKGKAQVQAAKAKAKALPNTNGSKT